MAIMKPDAIPEESPWSERIIFDNLRRSTPRWVVFYSKYVDNQRNPTRPFEIDFVILFPEYCSVICLEVKSGHYEIRGGQWYRRGANAALGTSPLDQSRNAMFALRNQHEDLFHRESLLSIGCAVAFTDGNISANANQHNQHLTYMIDSTDAINPDRLVKELDKHAKRISNEVRDQYVRRIARQAPNRGALQLQLAQFELKKVEKNAQKGLYELQKKLEPADMSIGPQDPKTIFRSELETLRPELLRLTANQQPRSGRSKPSLHD